MNWQPIETAPRDGTPILACGDADLSDPSFIGEDVPCVVRWHNTYGGDRYYWELFHYDAFQYNPSHWLPLPEPPQLVNEK